MDPKCCLCGKESSFLIKCSICPKHYHLYCLQTTDALLPNWECPSHRCRVCGLHFSHTEARIYACIQCSAAFCIRHLSSSHELLTTSEDPTNPPKHTSIICKDCKHRRTKRSLQFAESLKEESTKSQLQQSNVGTEPSVTPSVDFALSQIKPVSSSSSSSSHRLWQVDVNKCPDIRLIQIVKREMINRSILQKQLAEELRVSQSTLSSYLTGKTRATGWTTLEKKLLNWLQQQQQQQPPSLPQQQQQQQPPLLPQQQQQQQPPPLPQQQQQQQPPPLPQQQRTSIVPAFYYETHDSFSLALSTESPIQTSLVTTNRQYHRESVEEESSSTVSSEQMQPLLTSSTSQPLSPEMFFTHDTESTPSYQSAFSSQSLTAPLPSAPWTPLSTSSSIQPPLDFDSRSLLPNELSTEGEYELTITPKDGTLQCMQVSQSSFLTFPSVVPSTQPPFVPTHSLSSSSSSSSSSFPSDVGGGSDDTSTSSTWSLLLPSQNLPQSSFPSTSLPSFIESPQQNLLSTTTAPSPSELFVQQHPLRLTDTLSESSTVPNTNTLNFTTDQQKDINKK